VMPYVKNKQIFKCPDGVASDTGCWGGTWAGWSGDDYSYGVAASMVQDSACFGKYTRTRGVQEGKIANPANCIIMADHGWPGLDIDDWNGTDTGGTFCPNVNWRHNEGFNCGYADGHSKWLARKAAATNKSWWTYPADPD